MEATPRLMQHTIRRTTEITEAAWLEQLLRGEIPLARAMDLRVRRLDESGIELHAPLAPNKNDKGTAFGGSILSLMTLAGWSLLRILLERDEIDADPHSPAGASLVIAGCEVKFLAPVESDLVIRCNWPDAEKLAAFRDRLRTRGRARLALSPELIEGTVVAATMVADFAAILREKRT